jgi:uncharacterized DUF497 family protein
LVEFEWDHRKAERNLTKHGISFELATTVFDDPRLVLGVLTVRFTVRGDRVRIIGAGYWRRGKVFYEKTNRLH